MASQITESVKMTCTAIDRYDRSSTGDSPSMVDDTAIRALPYIFTVQCSTVSCFVFYFVFSHENYDPDAHGIDRRYERIK